MVRTSYLCISTSHSGIITVTNHDDSRQGVLQYNRYEHNSLSPLGTDQWLQYKRYFKIADFISTINLMQRTWEAWTGDYSK